MSNLKRYWAVYGAIMLCIVAAYIGDWFAFAIALVLVIDAFYVRNLEDNIKNVWRYDDN